MRVARDIIGSRRREPIPRAQENFLCQLLDIRQVLIVVGLNVCRDQGNLYNLYCLSNSSKIQQNLHVISDLRQASKQYLFMSSILRSFMQYAVGFYEGSKSPLHSEVKKG
jgi:hypothetical protein